MVGAANRRHCLQRIEATHPQKDTAEHPKNSFVEKMRLRAPAQALLLSHLTSGTKKLTQLDHLKWHN